MDVPASSLLIRKKPAEAFTPCAPKLSDALEKYCRLKVGGRADLFFRSSFRNIGYVIEHLGDRPLDTYSLSDAASSEIGLLVGDYHHHLSGEYSRRSVLSLR
jgi:hypothetical protein